MEGAVQFAIGDWLNYGERHYERGRYKQAVTLTGFAKGTLMRFASVSKVVESLRRHKELKFEHHAVVAPLDTDRQSTILSLAAKGNGTKPWTVAQTRLYIRQHRAVKEAGALPDGEFRLIEADPPWQLEQTGHRGTVRNYPTMATSAILAMGQAVGQRAAKNSFLLLWAINSMLPEAFEVMKAWGFTYKTCLTWVKEGAFGTGFYFRGATEHCLLGAKGHPMVQSHSQRSYFLARKGKHSEKPDEFYKIVERTFQGPYISLFSRKKRTGWSTWGNEAE